MSIVAGDNKGHSIVSGPGGNSGAFYNWVAEAPKTPPGAQDSDFVNMSGFSNWNAAGDLTATANNRKANLAITTVAGNNRCGIYQAPPAATEYAFACKLEGGYDNPGANIAGVGLMTAQDIAGSPSGASFIEYTMFCKAGLIDIAIQSWTNRTTFGSTIATFAGNTLRNFFYFRIRYKETAGPTRTLRYDFSTTGYEWYALSSTTVAAAPLYIGVCAFNNNADTAYFAATAWRVASGAGSADFNALTMGNLVLF